MILANQVLRFQKNNICPREHSGSPNPCCHSWKSEVALPDQGRKAAFRAADSMGCTAALPQSTRYPRCALCAAGCRGHPRITSLRPRVEMVLTGGTKHLGPRVQCECRGSATSPVSAGSTKGKGMGNKIQSVATPFSHKYSADLAFAVKKSF